MPEDQYINVGNLKTRYWALGDQGTVVILIHGLGASADIWKHNVETFAKQHRVYVPDLIGFGRSDKPGPSFSPFDYARFLDDFMKIFNIDREEVLAPVMNNLDKITQPTLIIWGEKDRVLPLKHAYRGKEKLPNAKLKIIEGCGHIPFFERSEEFNRLVLGFLSE